MSHNKKRKFKKSALIIIIALLVIGACVGGGLFYKKQEDLKKEKLREEKELVEKIKNAYSKYVNISNASIYQLKGDKYVEAGKIVGSRDFTLDEIKIDKNTEYFHINELDYYVKYTDVKKVEALSEKNTRYKNYLPFNENVKSNSKFSLYEGDNAIYQFNDKVLDTAIIEKADNGYMVEFNGEELLIKSEDVSEVYAKENTTAVESTSVPVTVYHFIYLEGDSSCNESICHPESQIKEQFNYLRENNFFTMNTTELGKFIDGKIRVPEKSILITIDDGARAWNFIPILEEYKINATLFLISGWYPLDKFSSPYLEVASHTHDLHHGRQCPGGQGSPLKCKPKEELLADLRTSREVLGGTKAFCFPFYEYNDYAVSVLKEAGFEMAFIGGGVKATKGIDKFHIPRISLNRWTSLSQYARYVN